MEGMIPTARSLRRMVAGRERLVTHSRREDSARSRRVVMVGWFQVDMLGTIQLRRGWCSRRKGEVGEKVKRKFDSPPKTYISICLGAATKEKNLPIINRFSF